MMDSITIGAKIRLTESVGCSYSVVSIAAVLYIDDTDNVFVKWMYGRLFSFSEQRLLNGFEEAQGMIQQKAVTFTVTAFSFVYKSSARFMIRLSCFLAYCMVLYAPPLLC